MENTIYLSPPNMNGMEFQYLYKAFHQNWIAPLGENVDGFEDDLCKTTASKAAVSLSSGSSAVFLGLKALGVGKGDTVFCSDLTFAGSCFPIVWLDAEPVFIDSEPTYLNISPDALESALSTAEKAHRLPKAAVIVDLYGNPADYDRILPILQEYKIPVLEDSAEALGSTLHDHHCGTFGKIGIFSFNGNKIITTSGGGAAVSDNPKYIEKIRFWATQSKEPVPYYEHKEIGYNFRLSNICAGIGRGQLLSLDSKMQQRRHIRNYYSKSLNEYPVRFVCELPDARANCWLSVMLLEPGYEQKVTEIISELKKQKIESRHMWKPMHDQPVFKNCAFFPHTGGSVPVSTDLFNKGICLPSGETLTDGQLDQIVNTIKSCF